MSVDNRTIIVLEIRNKVSPAIHHKNIARGLYLLSFLPGFPVIKLRDALL
jgi:hypothetical protein